MNTAQDFYQLMAQHYEAATGLALHEASDPAIRFRLLAEQLALLSERLESAYQQAFPATASGEALEFHAAARGLVRKPASCAYGRLRFQRSFAGTEVRLPAGLLCETAEGLAFETTEEAVFAADHLQAFASARAVQAGGRGNILPEQVVRCRNERYTVTNPWQFTGGYEQEDDRQLRQRLLASWSGHSNGANGAYYRALALEQPGIQDAVVHCDDARNITIYVAAGEELVPMETIGEMMQRMQALREPCSTVLVQNAVPKPVDVTLQIEPIGVLEQAVSKLQALLKDQLNQLPIGKRLTCAQLYQLVMESRLVKNCLLLAPTEDVYATAGQVLRAGSISIAQMGGPV